MTLVGEIVIVGCSALGVAGAAMLLARLIGVRARAAWALSMALGYVAGHVTMTRAIGWSPALAQLLSPGEARDRLPLAVLIGAGVSVFAAYAPRDWRRQIARLAGALVAIVVPLRLLAGSVYVTSRWSGAEKVGQLALLAAALGGAWGLLATARDDDAPRLRASLLFVTAMASAVVLANSGAAIYGQLCGVVAAAIVGATASEWLNFKLIPNPQRAGPSPASNEIAATALAKPVAHEAPSTTGISGAAGVLTMSLGSLIVLAHYFAELTTFDAVLLGVAAIAGGGWMPAPMSSWPKSAAFIRTAVCLAALGWAIFRCLAIGEASPAASPYSM